SDYTAVVDATGVAQFQTTRELALNEGLTIALGWPKGIVAEPGDLQKLVWLLADNVNLLIVVAGLIATLSYYIPVWQNYGKDPSQGTNRLRDFLRHLCVI
ncbi:MAG: hypothetical protein O2880_07920, partial [Proteobacteria bacterium]|nr:hypothetical protein [Pseudomonadota bacterium]